MGRQKELRQSVWAKVQREEGWYLFLQKRKNILKSSISF